MNGIFTSYLEFCQIKHRKIIFIFLKHPEMSEKLQNSDQHAFYIKIKKIQGIKMVSIKENTHIMHWNITFFCRAPSSQQKINKTTK